MAATGARERRAAFLVAAAACALGLARLWPQIPRDQTVHYVLGDAAPRVEEIDARWAEGQGEDFARGASFRYARGTAPRVVTHEPRLRDGDYTVQIEIVASGERSVVERRVVLSGGSTSIDLAQAAPPERAPAGGPPTVVAR